MSLAGVKLKALVVQTLRQILFDRGFDEYFPQLMSGSQPLEPAIYPFKTYWDKNHTGSNDNSVMYLATSPEGYLKQVMAAANNNCFAISHAFRNLEGEGLIHQPEFLMAEWYEKGVDWQHMMKQTQQLVLSVWRQISPKNIPPADLPWEIISFRHLWKQYFNVELDTLLTKQSMEDFAKAKGYQIVGATWEQLFYQLVFNQIEPHYPDHPFFLIDFPARISPLAKPQPSSPEFAERFELIINRVELANGNTENTDINHIKTMMKQEQQLRSTAHESPPLDQQFINSVKQLQSHSWAGVGLGIDRLTMLIGNIKSIQDVQWP